MRFSPRECNTMRSAAHNMIQGMYNGSRFANATMIVSLQWMDNYFLNPLFLKLTHTLFYHSVAYVLGMYVILQHNNVLMQSYLPSCCIHRIPLCPPVQILGPIARAGQPARGVCNARRAARGFSVHNGIHSTSAQGIFMSQLKEFRVHADVFCQVSTPILLLPFVRL